MDLARDFRKHQRLVPFSCHVVISAAGDECLQSESGLCCVGWCRRLGRWVWKSRVQSPQSRSAPHANIILISRTFLPHSQSPISPVQKSDLAPYSFALIVSCWWQIEWPDNEAFRNRTVVVACALPGFRILNPQPATTQKEESFDANLASGLRHITGL